VILSDSKAHETLNRASLAADVAKVVVIRGQSAEEISHRLEVDFLPKAQADAAAVLRELLRETVTNSSPSPLALSIVATSSKLVRELELAIKGIRRAAEGGLNTYVWTDCRSGGRGRDMAESFRIVLYEHAYTIAKDLLRVWRWRRALSQPRSRHLEVSLLFLTLLTDPVQDRADASRDRGQHYPPYVGRT